MKKGVILEIKERYVTLLTPDGEFMRTRKLQQDYQLGEELYFYPMEAEAGKTAKVLTSLKGMKGRLILLSLVMFLAVVLFPVYESRQAYAYMSIDVNPSIELGLNEKLLVISMEAFNQEGEEIIDNMTDWKQQRAVVVATQILNEMEGMGYLNQEREVLISTVNSENQSVDIELEETVKEIQKVTVEEELVVTVLTATPEERENAVKQGISAGVYKQKQEPNNKNYTRDKDDLEKDKVNKPETVEKGSSSEEHPSTNGQKNEKGRNNEQDQKKAEKELEKEKNNEKKSNNGDRKENSNNPKHHNDKQNKDHQNNGNTNKGNQNNGNPNKGNQNKEEKHRGNGNAANGKN
ncbi:anti-sigma factor domain-containing protein [Mesobacillus maritimus]|uniref:anti-sigma factor domain-containing protein n=1 Tax=Mesobacillus maritimus TaxID=1643336 RepID=UPI0038514C7C